MFKFRLDTTMPYVDLALTLVAFGLAYFALFFLHRHLYRVDAASFSRQWVV
jgi:hypothetical protein